MNMLRGKSHRSFARGILGLSCSFVAMTWSVAASAQAAEPAEVPSADAGDIIVTAQRRSENLRDVPISITALSEDRLERSGIMSTLDLPRIAPGLEMPASGGFVQPAIRGVSSAGSDVGDSSNVAVYVDGVYRPSQTAQLMDLPDVQRIEVLKGPQGTLYGQGAEGGAIVITTFAPSFTTTGNISLSYGNFDTAIARGYISGPLSDTVAVSVAGSYERHDGYRNNLLTGTSDKGLESGLIRGKLLFEPSDSASFTLAGFWSRRKDGGPYSGQALNGRSIGYFLFPGAPRPSSPREVALNTPTYVDVEASGVSLNGVFDIGAGTITSVTSFTKNKGWLTVDVDYSPVNLASIFILPLTPDQKFFTQDISFVSKDWGRAVLTAGAFLMSSNEGYRPQSFTVGDGTLGGDPTSGNTVRQFQHIKRFIVAGYAELTYDLTDSLTVSAGGRYSYERQKGYADLFGFAPEEIPSPFNPAVFKKFTPRVTARYKISPRSTVYANYSQGFKSGILSTSALTSAPAKPETLTSYEIGYKGIIADGVSVNIAAFHYDWKGLQVQRYVPPQSIYENAASARSKGIDFDATFRVSPDLTFSLGGVYLDGKYRDYPLAGVFTPNASGGNDNSTINASGLRMMRAPKLSGTFSADYSAETGIGKLGLSGSAYYNSGSKLEVSGRIRQPEHVLLDAQISLSPKSADNLNIALYARNISNKAYIQSLLVTNFADGVTYAPPRTFGIRVKFDF